MNPTARKKAFSFLLAFLAAAILGAAIQALLPATAQPALIRPVITVTCSWNAESPRAVEQSVTTPMEKILSRIPGITDIISSSTSSTSTVEMEFDRTTDMVATRFEVASAIRHIWPSLPEGTSYPAISVTRNERGADIKLYITSPQPLSEITDMALNTVVPALSETPGTGSVTIAAGTEKCWKVVYNHPAMQTAGITVQDVVHAIISASGSTFVTTTHESGLTANLFLENGMEMTEQYMASLPVKRTGDGRIITLGNVAGISVGESEQSYRCRVNGQDAVIVSVAAAPASDIFTARRNIRHAISHLQLPEGYRIALEEDNIAPVTAGLSALAVKLLLLLLSLIAAYAIISRNMRQTVMMCASLMASLAIAGIFYYPAGISFCPETMVGLTVAIVLDFQIIGFTSLGTGFDRRQRGIALCGASLLCLLMLAYIHSRLVADGISFGGAFTVVIINLFVDIPVVLFMIPAWRTYFGVTAGVKSQAGIPSRFLTGYIGFIRRFRPLVTVLLVAAFGIPLFLLPEKMEGDNLTARIYNHTLGSEFYHTTLSDNIGRLTGGALRLFNIQLHKHKSHESVSKKASVIIGLKLPDGTEDSRMSHYIDMMENRILPDCSDASFKVVKSSSTKASIEIRLADGQTDRAADIYRTAVDAASALGGAEWDISGPLGSHYTNALHDSFIPKRITLSGYNYDRLLRLSLSMRDSLLANRRINRVDISSATSMKYSTSTQFLLSVDSNLPPPVYSSDRLGMAIADWNIISSPVNFSLSPGQSAVTAVNLISGSPRQDIWHFSNEPIPVGQSRLKADAFTSSEPRNLPADINRQNRQFVISLLFDYQGDSEVGRRVIKRIVEKQRAGFPTGFSAEIYNMEIPWMIGSKTDMTIILVVAAILFLVPTVTYNSFRAGVATLAACMLSTTGGMATFYHTGMMFHNGVVIALVVAVCMTVFNMFLILSGFFSAKDKIRRNRLRIPGSTCGSGITAMALAYGNTLAPIFLTMLATELSMLVSVGSDMELWSSFSTIMAGGIVSSLISVLLVTPLITTRR